MEAAMPWAIFFRAEKVSADFTTKQLAWAEAFKMGIVKDNISNAHARNQGTPELDEGYGIVKTNES
jgi:hypothetical protein